MMCFLILPVKRWRRKKRENNDGIGEQKYQDLYKRQGGSVFFTALYADYAGINGVVFRAYE